MNVVWKITGLTVFLLLGACAEERNELADAVQVLPGDAAQLADEAIEIGAVDSGVNREEDEQKQ